MMRREPDANRNPFRSASSMTTTNAPAPEVTEPVDDGSLKALIGELGNQIHNLGCERQNDEALSIRLDELRSEAWRLAGIAPAHPPQPDALAPPMNDPRAIGSDSAQLTVKGQSYGARACSLRPTKGEVVACTYCLGHRKVMALRPMVAASPVEEPCPVCSSGVILAAPPSGDWRAAMADLIPTNIALNNPAWSDDTVIPVDVTLGQLRRASEVLERATPEQRTLLADRIIRTQVMGQERVLPFSEGCICNVARYPNTDCPCTSDKANHMTQDEYLNLVGELTGGPGGDQTDWNTRFRASLAEHGLELIPAKAHPLPDEDWWVWAPAPYGPEDWWSDSWIAPIDRPRYG